MSKNLWVALLQRHQGNRRIAREVLHNMVVECLNGSEPVKVLWVRHLPPTLELDLVYAAEQYSRGEFGQ
jgi:hypothetical protein